MMFSFGKRLGRANQSMFARETVGGEALDELDEVHGRNSAEITVCQSRNDMRCANYIFVATIMMTPHSRRVWNGQKAWETEIPPK